MIEIDDLRITFRLPGVDVCAVNGVSIAFPDSKITGIIGESGCGKSVLGLALLGLLPPYAKVEGRLKMDGEALTSERARSRLGVGIGLVTQNPAESLNPARTIAFHLREALLPLKLPSKDVKERSARLLRDFGFTSPERILRAYPHELSGGMQQRVLCAIGSACAPKWMLADEPTKGLDRDLRDQVRDTLRSLKDFGVESMLVITHDLPLARELCDNLAVMYAGQIVEMGPRLLEQPMHPYTRAFLNALPENGFQAMTGVAPRAGERLPGCPFAPRCSHAKPRCHRERPSETAVDGRIVRCFLYA